MKKKEKKKLVILLFISLIWFIGSTAFYTCNIKGFCNKERQGFVKVNQKNSYRGRKIQENMGVRYNVGVQNSEGDFEKYKKTILISYGEEKNKSKRKIIKCMTYLNSYIRFGKKNIYTEVEKLETFLNKYYNTNLEVNGVYEQKDKIALMRFQETEKLEADGILGKTTLDKINTIKCLRNNNYKIN